MRDGARFFILFVAEAVFPGYVAVDGDDEVVDVDGEVGVDALREIYPHRYRGHDHRGDPHACVGVVLPPQVGQTDDEAENLEKAGKVHPWSE